MTEPPQNFVEDAYIAANPDVQAAIRVGQFESGWDHYRRCGYLEQRALNPEALMSRNDKLCAGLDFSSMTGAEIGPLTNPVITKTEGNVLYIDHADTDTLRRKYENDPKIDPDQIVLVDHVWGSQTLSDCVGAGIHVDYVIASHVVEHVPDFVTWFEEVHAILKPGGTVRLALPDRRFTFDILRAESTLADVLDSYVRRARIPLSRAILDHFINHADIDAVSAWTGCLEGLHRTHTPEFALQAAKRSFREGNYQDTHCWVFTPLSFARLGAALARMGLARFACDRIYPMHDGELEFLSILRAAEAGECVASWERIASELEVNQGIAPEVVLTPEQSDADIVRTHIRPMMAALFGSFVKR